MPMTETATISEREGRLWHRLKGDVLNVALAAVTKTDGNVRTATTYLMETVGEIVKEREAEVRRQISVLASPSDKENTRK